MPGESIRRRFPFMKKEARPAGSVTEESAAVWRLRGYWYITERTMPTSTSMALAWTSTMDSANSRAEVEGI